MAANPSGAHQVGLHIADHMASNLARSWAYSGVPADKQTRKNAGTGTLPLYLLEGAQRRTGVTQFDRPRRR